MPRSISILGCGWLGFPLAQRLISCGYQVKGSTTTIEKVECLRVAGIEPYRLLCNPQVTIDPPEGFFDSSVLFLNIPFKRRLEDPQFYAQQIDSLLPLIESSSIKHVIFVSSTSIYPSNLLDAKEDSVFQPNNQRSRVLFDIECKLLMNPKFTTTVVRFGGLYGADRQIGKFLTGKNFIENGNAPVNLIHLDDCIRIVQKIIEHPFTNDVFNAVSDGHPIKDLLYTQKAKAMQLPIPQFLNDPTQTFKVVNNSKLKKKYSFQFQHPDPLQ